MGCNIGKSSRPGLLITVSTAILCAILVVTSGCRTATPGTIFANPTDSAYKYYLLNKADINANRLIAAVSYSASLVSNNKVSNWNGLTRLLKLYEGQLHTGNVSPNYPEKLNAIEAGIFSSFVGAWCTQHKNRVDISDAPAKYIGDANNLIFRIINNEYHR